MKKINVLISATLLFSTTYADIDLSWVDKQIEAIQPERSGIADKNINSIKEPFIFLNDDTNSTKVSSPNKVTKVVKAEDGTVKKVIVTLKPLKLSAIMNQNALINQKWYKLNDKIRDYKLIKIEKNHIILKDRYNKNKKMYITTKNENIDINIK